MGGYVGNAPDQTANLYDERYAPITRSRKNLLINGGFQVWQRGATGSLPLSVFTYMADRWVADCYGAALTWAQGNTPTSPNHNPGSLVITGASGNTGFSVHQRIEAAHAYHTYGKKLTVSGWMYLTGAARNITPQLYRPNTKNAFSSLTLVDGGTTIAHPGGGAWIPFSYTFATKMPLQVANGLTLLFSSPAHGAGLNFALADVQLEIGEEVTEFDRRDITDEFLQCQRYFRTNMTMRFVGTVQNVHEYVTYTFSPAMRVAPVLENTSWTPQVSTWEDTVASASTQTINGYARMTSAPADGTTLYFTTNMNAEL